MLLTDHVFGGLDAEREALSAIGYEFEQAPATGEQTLVERASGAKALLVCFAPVTKAVVRAAVAGGCRIIARYGIGVDNIPVQDATDAGILVTNVPDYCLEEVADHAMALLLGVSRGAFAASAEVRDGGWAFPREDVRRLRGRRLALIGVGRIGRRVADRARAFGYEIAGFDPFVQDWAGTGISPAASVEEAVAEADAISLHAPLTADTRHIIGARTLPAMRRRPVIVNTSRGGLVDLEALARGLDDGTVGAAALDVTEPEPLPRDHPLRKHPRVVVTPHMSYYSAEAEDELQRRAVDEVVRALTGAPPRCPVNLEVLA